MYYEIRDNLNDNLRQFTFYMLIMFMAVYIYGDDVRNHCLMMIIYGNSLR